MQDTSLTELALYYWEKLVSVAANSFPPLHE